MWANIVEDVIIEACVNFIKSKAMSSKLEIFINKAQNTHGNKFDYSLVDYVNSSTKIKIICPMHGVFEQLPAEHVRGRGCHQCHLDGPRNFLEKAKKKHGDRYDYSNIQYVNCSTPVEIICRKHGVFYQTPVGHIAGYGCQKCGRENVVNCLSYNTNKFIINAKTIHGNRYDYSKVKYINCHTKVIIGCDEHGQFLMAPRNHVNQKQGCPKCAIIHVHNEIRLTNEEFIEKAHIVHGNKYYYNLVNYTHSKGKIEIICPIHGIFSQTANGHLNGKGCYECSPTKKLTQQEFLDRAKQIHGKKYSYAKTKYIDIISTIIITCPKHGDFPTTAHSHLNSSSGCPHCLESKGEMRIRNILDKHNITYKAQWKFKSRDVRKMKFDFVVWFNKTIFIIEYQGRQHYLPHAWGSDKSMVMKINNLRKVQSRDMRKCRWCQDKGLQFIAIPYWDFDRLENIVVDFLECRDPMISKPPEAVIQQLQGAL